MGIEQKDPITTILPSMVSSMADRCNEQPCEGGIETLTLNDIEEGAQADSNGTTQNCAEYSGSSAPSTPQIALQACATSRRLCRRRSSSSVSFEKDSLVIFQEMSKLVDEEDNQEHGDSNNTETQDEERGINDGNSDNSVEENTTTDLISQQVMAVRRRSSRVSICSLASVREEGSNNGSDDGDDEDNDDANGMEEQHHHHHTNTEYHEHSIFDSSILSVTMKFDKVMLDQRACRRANDQNGSSMAHSVSVPSSLHRLERDDDGREETPSNLPSTCSNANSIGGTFRRGRRRSVSFDVR